MDGKKAAEGPRVTITIITTYLANNLWTGSIGGMIMLPAKLKTFHDDLMDGVHTKDNRIGHKNLTFKFSFNYV